jgi:hypothetical protein
MERTAPAAYKGPAGGFLDRREVLRLSGDRRRTTRNLRVSFEGERTGQNYGRDSEESDQQLAH